jgi:hypothetical protein
MYVGTGPGRRHITFIMIEHKLSVHIAFLPTGMLCLEREVAETLLLRNISKIALFLFLSKTSTWNPCLLPFTWHCSTLFRLNSREGEGRKEK